LLFALPFAVYIIATRRHDLPKVAKIAGLVALGALPGIVVALAYNYATAGNLTEFPTTVQSAGYSKFGWGVRSIAPDTPPLDFHIGEAFESMGTNLWALPTWLFGTYLTLGFAVFGAVKLWRRQRATCALLLGLTFIWPVGYLAWWASSLTTNGALNGLGPHYYLPMLAPLAILAAHGIGELAEHRRAVLVGVLGLAVILTGIALVPKIDEKHIIEDSSREYSGQVTRGLRQRNGQPALVIEERRPRATYIMEPFPYLANPPDLETSVLYARDRGARNVDLLDRTRGRRVYRLVRQLEPGHPINRLPVVVKPQSVIRGPQLSLHTTIINTAGERTVTAYARFGQKAERRVLDTSSKKGEQYDVTWTVSPAGFVYSGPPARRIPARKVKKADSRGSLIVGATFAKSLAVRDPSAVERRYYARVKRESRTEVEVLTADEEWTRFGAPIHAWLPISVGSALEVDITPTTTAP
jgi:hypothetical protein